MSAGGSAQVVSLAARLKTRREELGLSQAQAARELDVARTAYRLWEMEAAKPQPDRWRLISRWLGVSVATMLLADEPGGESGVAGDAFARGGSTWDGAVGDPAVYFARARAMVRQGAEDGFFGPEHEQQLLAIMARAEEEHSGDTSETWEPARLQKQFRVDLSAPAKARRAVDFVGGDLPAEKLLAARLLASELVSIGVKRGSEADPMIGFLIEVGRSRLRVEVRNAAGSPGAATAEENDGYGILFVERLSNRWGGEEQEDGNVTWFELDLPAPGGKPERP